jgi:hypothetical protein
MRCGSLVAGVVTFALALGGCGGDDEKGGGSAASSDAPSLDTVLDCLKVDGLNAKDQSTSTGEKIGIDYPGGRTVISFEDSPEDAETLASVAEANGETTVVEGSVVATIPADPAAESDQAAIEECVGS